MRTSGLNAKIAGKIFAISSADQGSTWACGRADDTSLAALMTDLDIEYLPSSCK